MLLTPAAFSTPFASEGFSVDFLGSTGADSLLIITTAIIRAMVNL